MDLTLPLFDMLEDIWGNINGLKMSFAGNQWFVSKDLISLLNSKGYKIYLETIPPGIVRKRAEGEPLKIGNLEISFKPEIVSLPPAMLEGLNIKEKFDYVENEIVIVYTKNEIKDWCEVLGKRVAIPNPKTEGIGKNFMELYEENCGNYEELANSGVYITMVHHREIPHMLKLGDIEAGIMWKTEALYWGFKYSIPHRNKISKLSFALLENSTEKAKEVYEILKSNEVKSIYEKYGFKWIKESS
jgi:molybdate transport system substrate-binding protein